MFPLIAYSDASTVWLSRLGTHVHPFLLASAGVKRKLWKLPESQFSVFFKSTNASMNDVLEYFSNFFIFFIFYFLLFYLFY